MNENLFTFPAEPGDQSREKLFDLSGFVQLEGEDSENPFAAMLTGAEAAGPARTDNADLASGNSPAADWEHQESDTTKPTVESDVEAQRPQTPPPPQEMPAQVEFGENPLMAALTRQEEKNARKEIEPIFAKPPVFYYNGTEEPIENIEQTFEELRLAKADDFPEFDEGKNVSWTVTYGKITKTVLLPGKTKIGQFKREIEASKDFLNALKKSTDKQPRCLVKPVIRMQKKGEASSYKGAFLHLSEARASPKTISFIPGRDGKVYERRMTNAGEFITPVIPAETISVLDEIQPGFRSSLPKIPYSLMAQALSLFRTLMHRGKGQRPVEALVNIYWDKVEQRYFIHVPKQVVSSVSVDAMLDNEDLQDDERYIHYADLHSHNQMPAVFSKTDDRDERATRVYMVAGRLHRYFPELTVRISSGGRFLKISPEQVVERPPMENFPLEWLEQIHTDANNRFEVAA